jgi:hypothetical protein
VADGNDLKPMEFILFLGSGVSYESGLPRVGEITRSLLNDEWHSHTDELFYPGPQPNSAFRSQNLVLRIQPFLKLLKSYADGYFALKRGTEANYEDLYYLARQLIDDYRGRVENPAILGFVLELKDRIKELCTPIPVTEEEVTFERLADRACDFIQCAVWHMLYSDKTPLGMDIVKELALSQDIKRLDIFTLNHDFLVENLFESNGIHFEDGFGAPDGQVCYFEPSCYDSGGKVRLFKLHGSVNWFLFRSRKNKTAIDQYGKSKQSDFWHLENGNGNLLMNLGGTPIFLSGTYNKIFDYGSGIHAEMHFRFYQSLKESDIMVMSGYGWNDPGVNTRLMEWVYSSDRKLLYLLHKNPEAEIRDKSKSGMWHSYEDLVKDGRLIPIKKWLSELNRQELFQTMGV